MYAKIVVGTTLFSVSCAVAAADPLPSEFRGTWAYSWSNDGKCKSADHHITSTNTDDEGVMVITPHSTLHSEWGCDIASVKAKVLKPGEVKQPTDPIIVGLACGGEGETFKEREVWSLQHVLQQEVLVVHNLSRSVISTLLRCE